MYGVGHGEIGAANFLAAFWTGAVAVGYSDASRDVALHDIFPSHVFRAWQSAVGALREYGGAGEVHVAITLNRNLLSEGRLEGLVEVRRWTDLRDPTDDEIASVHREVQRALGRAVLEG